MCRLPEAAARRRVWHPRLCDLGVSRVPGKFLPPRCPALWPCRLPSGLRASRGSPQGRPRARAAARRPRCRGAAADRPGPAAAPPRPPSVGQQRLRAGGHRVDGGRAHGLHGGRVQRCLPGQRLLGAVPAGHRAPEPRVGVQRELRRRRGERLGPVARQPDPAPEPLQLPGRVARGRGRPGRRLGPEQRAGQRRRGRGRRGLVALARGRRAGAQALPVPPGRPPGRGRRGRSLGPAPYRRGRGAGERRPCPA
mmetsp:Transcript_24478/g.68774  ORF Transcript_24478/g.68774 Transcript_24478/m.68774 type:complete len:252 (+) Transcript_24478:106-861(+)